MFNTNYQGNYTVWSKECNIMGTQRRQLFENRIYYSQSYFDSLAEKKEKLEGRIELCTTAARVYLSLTIPKPKPATTPPPTPPIPNPLRRTVDRPPT